MIIAIDARAWSWAGVGRYVRNLITELAALDRTNKYIILVGREDEVDYRKNKILAQATNFSVRLVSSSYYSWQEQIIFCRQAEKAGADLWHFPNFNVPLFFRKPYVVTIHDITRFIFPGQKEQGLIKQVVYEQVFKRAVERAAGVIFVSATTKKEIKSLPIKVAAINRVVYEGVEKRFRQQIKPEAHQKISEITGGRRYLLYVGVWMSHKNLSRLLQAYAQITHDYPDVDLVLTGEDRPGFVDVKRQAKQLGIHPGRVKFVGQVSDSLLPALYAGAQALVFPSLYEGFGLPAIEAAACGTPVIAANVTSLPEIMAGAALYVNPEYVLDIKQAIECVLDDDVCRNNLKQAGLGRAKEFDWEKCARESLEFYCQLGQGQEKRR